MAGFLTRIENTRKNGEMYAESSSLKQTVIDMKAFQPVLDAAKTKVSQVIDLYHALQSIRISQELDLSSFEGETASILDDIEHDRYFKWKAEKLQQISQRAESDLKESWLRYVSSRISGPKNILSSLISVLPEEKTGELGALERKIKVSKPCSAEALTAIDEYLEVFSRITKEINLDDEVLYFLNEIKANGFVPINAVSVSCFEKLQRQDFASKIRIAIQ